MKMIFKGKLSDKEFLKEIEKALPIYDEKIQIKEGSSFLCKLLWHRRVIYHALVRQESKTDIKWYEAYVCVRCHNTIGKLVNISLKKQNQES